LHDPSGTEVVDRANLAFTTDGSIGDVSLIYGGLIVAQLTARRCSIAALSCLKW
jgi:hypothetical protein